MEKLRQAKTFSELKSGMIVVVKSCDCGSSHRGILTNRDIVIGPVVDDKGWAFEPAPKCADGFLGYGIDHHSVSSGYVFIVEDGLDLEAESKKEKANA